MKQKLRSFMWIIRIVGAFILLLGMHGPVHAAEFPNLEIFSIVPNGTFAQGDENKTYIITVKNSGGEATDGIEDMSVVVTLPPAGLTFQTLTSADGWSCGGLTCTRLASAPMASGETSVITLKVDVNVNAPVDVTMEVLVSGGGDPDTDPENTRSNTTTIEQKPDLHILDWEYWNEAKTEEITGSIPVNQPFWIKMILENRGGADTSNFYTGVFLDGEPNFGPDHDPLGGETDWADYQVSSEGCVYYGPGGETATERGNYTQREFLEKIPPYTIKDDVYVHIAYPLSEPEYFGSEYDNIRNGLSLGEYNIVLYADPNCLGPQESVENNNVAGPFTLNVGVPIDVTIGGTNMGTYLIPKSESQRVNYVGVDSGPVKVASNDGTPIIAALREAYFVGGELESFVQLMGLPKESLSTKYYFPAYNNVTLDGQLRFGNVGNSATTVTVTIAGVVRGTYPLNPGEAKRINYTGLDSGPVVVQSSGGVPIIAALRDAYYVDGRLESFAQLMGLPAEKLSTKYYFPAYNNVTLDGQLRIGNVGNSSTTVTVTIAGVVRGTHPLNPGQAVRINYAGLDAGPVIVESSGGVPIIAALRDAYFVSGKLVSFVQLMGLPQEQLSTNYNFPAYNNVTLDGQLRFGNVGNSATTVTVTIAGIVRGTYPLNPSETKRVNYVGLDAGPVVVSSSGGVPIIAALRDAYFVNGKVESFAQLMGLPLELLSSAYYFPAYNNVTLDGQLRFGVP